MRVWVTRDEERNGPLSRAFSAVGLDVVLEPVIARRLVDDCAEAIRRLGPDDWLVLTSVYAIEAVACAPARIPRVAVVGQETRRAAEAKGLRVRQVCSGATRESLFEDLRSRVKRGTICYPRSSEALAPEAWPGVEVLSPVMYETSARAFDREVIRRVDVVSVASPSAVYAIGRLELPFASIGPTTSAALGALGIEPWVEAPQRSFQSLATAVADCAKTVPPSKT